MAGLAERKHSGAPVAMPPLIVGATTPTVVLSRPWGIALDGLLASVLWQRTNGPPGSPERGSPTATTRCRVSSICPWRVAGTRPATSIGIGWRRLLTCIPMCGGVPRALTVNACSTLPRPSARGRSPVTVAATNTAPFRQRTIPVTAHPAATVTWRAVGDPEALLELLAELPSIGKHRDVASVES
jgi:hypothetical protein